MDTVYKILENCEVKKVGERQYEFTASTADMDRDGEVIDVSGWDLKNFKKNPVIMFGHDYRSLPIGKATKIGVRDGKLMDVVEFPPEGTYEFADIVQRLVDAGYLKTQSVGFIPKKWEDADFEDDEKGQKPRRTYTKQELLEISIVPVPSNPNALMNAVKEGVITQKQFKQIIEPEYPKDTEPENSLKPYPNEHACRLQPPDKFSEFRRGTRSHEGKKYSIIFGKPKEGEGWEEQAYRYDKDTWEASEARSHCKSHEGSFEAAKPEKTSQEQIIDEIDYLKSLIEKEGVGAGLKVAVIDLMSDMIKYFPDWEFKERISGSDIPVKIEPTTPPIEVKETFLFENIRDAIKRIASK